MKKSKVTKNNGITLIALVITIIILLILAGVTIAILTGENGILTKATESKEQTEIGEEKEAIGIAYNGVKIDNEGKGVSATDLQTELRNNGYNATVVDNGNGKLLVEFESGREYIIDNNGNITIGDNTGETIVEGVKIPEGFHHVEGTTITGGLVISDEEGDDLNNSADGNQYVWIPVDGILGEDGKTVQNAVDGEIILGRYVFDSNGDIDISLTPTTLGEELKIVSTDSYGFTETSTGNGNTVAKDIEGFIESVRQNGGYYIARFEASQNTETNKAESKYDKTVWNNITQPDASIACQDLCTGTNSDLMNSYAWDTAILFIQKYSGDEDYSRQFRLQSTLANTGKATDGTKYDVKSNIYDMAGNCREWTTESCTSTYNPCTFRGGTCGDSTSSSYYTCNRILCNISDSSKYTSFRSILYL